MPVKLHQDTFRIRFFEASPSGRATPGALCRFAQETADGHTRLAGIAISDLLPQNRTWVLTRLRLQMESYPRATDTIVVETWASSRTNGIRAVREFRFLDSQGAVLGRAASIWLMLDLFTKRPVRLPAAVLDLCNPALSDPEEFEFPRLQPPAAITYNRLLQVGWKDLDANNHLNNVNYLEYALEALPLEWNRHRELVQMDVEFLAEAFYADTIASEVEISESSCIHRIRNANGMSLSLAVSRWR